jgi:hypothetical protein
MSPVDKDIERLIIRRLDGELSNDEQLRLDRELIRNPEARRLLEEYGRIDESAAAALEAALGDDRPFDSSMSAPASDRQPRLRRYNPGRWLVPGAVAAALMAIVLARVQTTWISEPTIADNNHTIPSNLGQLPDIRPSSGDIMQTVGKGGTRVRRNTGREVFGVFGEDGNLYWIEVDRTLTVTQPKRGAGVRFTSEQM